MADIGLGHVCDYRDKRFVDGCHFVTIEKTCRDCGALHRETSPRDFDLNPLQIAFARSDCPRCRAALKGKEPASWTTAHFKCTHGGPDV
jgi:hypothetical protein